WGRATGLRAVVALAPAAFRAGGFRRFVASLAASTSNAAVGTTPSLTAIATTSVHLRLNHRRLSHETHPILFVHKTVRDYVFVARGLLDFCFQAFRADCPLLDRVLVNGMV